MAWPPITLATQHPDNACIPWWRSDPPGRSGSDQADAFLPTSVELDELLTLFKELPIDEYMWDWEGKYVDESVGEKLFARAESFFREHPLGEDRYLTYRIPAFDAAGKMHRMARAFMNVLAMADTARDAGMKRPPVTEMFLPLVTSAAQPIAVRKAFLDIAQYHRAVFHTDEERHRELLRDFAVTPLVEDVGSLLTIDGILRPYWNELLKQEPQRLSRGFRVFLARSDPALNSGLIPAVLAVKVALAACHDLGRELSVPVFPILGTGSLPFRGSVNPHYLDTALAQYAGTRTYSIQSAFRYDYPIEEVRSALDRIRQEAPKREAQAVSPEDRTRIADSARLFEGIWRQTIEPLAPLVNSIAEHVPARRERRLHIGLFGYSRGVGKVQLPRAIAFTCVLYSLGIPPELIATGRGLRALRFREEVSILDRFYPALREDLRHAGKYLNRENLERLCSEGWENGDIRIGTALFQGIREDISLMEEILGITLGPEKPRHLIHRNLTSTILLRLLGHAEKEPLLAEIAEAGKIRRSLG